MAKRGKPRPESELGPNVFEGPVRVGRVLNGELIVDYPAELREGVLLHRVFNGRDEPTGWEPIPLPGSGWGITEASDADLDQALAAGYDVVENRRGETPFDRKGMPFVMPPESADSESAPSGGESASPVVVRPMVMTADADELADKRRRLELIDAQWEVVSKARKDYRSKRDDAKESKATLEKEIAALEAIIVESKEEMPLFDAKRWESTPIGKLDLSASILAKLADAGITTLGRLAKHTADGRPLTTIDGIGPEAAEAIGRATEEFWRRNPGEAA